MIDKDSGIISDKRAIVACDLFLSLQLYRLPNWFQENLKIAFPNVEIIPVNTLNSSLTIEDATIYFGNRITSEIISKMPKLAWIHFGSVGVNRVDVEEMSKKCVLITSSKGLVVSPMVASALAFMTNLARGIHYSQVLRSKGNMNRDSFDQYFNQVHEISGESCLIVGFGDVGKKLAEVCKALGMNVYSISKSIKEHELIDSFYTLDQISDAVLNIDYIVNLLPLNINTEKVFTQQVFESMKSSAFFINIGRGETVDEEALILALKNKQIAGAGLDVFAQEPLLKSSPLWGMENVILSPHVAGLSSGYWDRQSNLFMNNLKCYLEGDKELMSNIVEM